MKKSIFVLFYSIFSIISLFSFAQKTNIYLLPGQGSDCRIFDSLKFSPKYNIHFLELDRPEKKANMASFAKSFIPKIDTNSSFILIGVSLGGMICSELNEILSPEKVIIISSAKNKLQLPLRYRFQKAIPFYKILPGTLLLLCARFLQPIVEPDRKKNEEVFKNMLKVKNPIYVKRTVKLIIEWDKNNDLVKNNIIQIHGSNDHTIPIKNVKANYIVKNGSHMMALTRFSEVQAILDKEL